MHTVDEASPTASWSIPLLRAYPAASLTELSFFTPFENSTVTARIKPMTQPAEPPENKVPAEQLADSSSSDEEDQ